MLVPSVLIALMIFWGGSFAAVRVALRYITPVELTYARFLPSAILLLIILGIGVLKSGQRSGFLRSLTRKQWLILIASSIFQVPLYHYCMNLGGSIIPSSWVGLVISLNPASIAIFSVILLNDKIGYQRWLGIALSFAGLIFIAIVNNSVTMGGSELTLGTKLWGMFVAFGAVVSFGISTSLSKNLVNNSSSFKTMAWVIIIGTIWLVPIGNKAFFVKIGDAPMELWLAVTYLSVICTVAGFAAWYWTIKKWTVSRAGAFIYLVPIGALIIGKLMFDESMNFSIILGFTLVLSGIFIAGGRDKSSAKNTK